MSTKKTTTNTNQYDTASMSAFHAMLPNMTRTLNDFMLNPLQSTNFATNLAMAYRRAQTAGQRMNNNALLNYSGNNVSGFRASQLAKNSRAVTGMQGDAFTSLLNRAADTRFNAASTATGFRPLQTGSTTTTKTSGLGTWLPQAVGMGASLLMGGVGGGAPSWPGGGNAATPAEGVAAQRFDPMYANKGAGF